MNILFFGDSNTYGTDPVNGGRHSRKVRFTGILQEELGEDYYIIEEGLGGRTIAFNAPDSIGRNGLTYLLPCLHSHSPLDLLVVMLGTNDTKDFFHASPEHINSNMKTFIKAVFDMPEVFSNKPNVLLVSPCIIKDGKGGNWTQSHKKSKELIPLLEKTAKKCGIFYMAASDFAQSSDEDLLHLTSQAHASLAKALKNKILEIEKTL